MNIARTVLTAAALVGAASSPAFAVTIDPAAVNGSSSFPTYEASFAVDGNPVTDWASNSQGTSTTLAIDLGGIFSLASGTFVDRVTSGGGNGGFVGGTTDFTTAFSIRGCTSFACTAFVGPALSFMKTTPIGPTGPGSFSFVANLTGLTGQFFLYSVTAANGPNPGLSELSFEGTAVPAVPEPATWALMILGFGVVGSALRRRRRTQVRFNFA